MGIRCNMQTRTRIIQPFIAILATALTSTPTLRADENLYGTVRTAETLPKGHVDIYHTLQFNTGKEAGNYRAWESELEFEYGFSDQLQLSIGAVQRYHHVRSVPGLDDTNRYHFGGVVLSAKYRVLSPFKDVVGLALRLEGGYLPTDDVAGLEQEEFYINPSIILQKNFLDDTINVSFNIGAQMAWGKKPAEEYDYELALEQSFGISYRFAPNWYLGVEERFRSEYPEADLGFHEHTVMFVGPSLHYGAKGWWTTLQYGFQVWGEEVDQTVRNKAFAEESRHEFRWKVGFSF